MHVRTCGFHVHNAFDAASSPNARMLPAARVADVPGLRLEGVMACFMAWFVLPSASIQIVKDRREALENGNVQAGNGGGVVEVMRRGAGLSGRARAHHSITDHSDPSRNRKSRRIE